MKPVISGAIHSGVPMPVTDVEAFDSEEFLKDEVSLVLSWAMVASWTASGGEPSWRICFCFAARVEPKSAILAVSERISTFGDFKSRCAKSWRPWRYAMP